MATATVPPAARTMRALASVAEERARQDAKWGAERHHVGVPAPSLAPGAPPQHLGLYAVLSLGLPLPDVARDRCEHAARSGRVTWGHILVEEVVEAIEAGAFASSVELRKELAQVAAVCVAWIEDLDRKGQPQ